MLSDCKECWDTPCDCGLYWKDESNKEMMKYLIGITKYHEEIQEYLKSFMEQLGFE